MIDLPSLLRFVHEDAPFGDITSAALLSGRSCQASVIARQGGIIAGLDESDALFSHYGVLVDVHARDGERVESGRRLLDLSGDAEAILLVERTALNVIGRMSGIATHADMLVQMVKAINPRVIVAATRKTAPGLRLLDKKAVLLGGGDPHRFSLSDMVLIKDNHLALVPLEEAIRRVRALSIYPRIEVEVSSAEEGLKAAAAGADIVMFDNLSPPTVMLAVKMLEKAGLRDRVLLEVSGGISANNIESYARLGIDIISIGALTHSVKNFDVSLEIQKAVRSFSFQRT
jgi:nicotinate-nucleotide pyrophosphorylase (carboxylating)